MTNEERSAIEVQEFCANPPDRYFAYVKLMPIPEGFHYDSGLGYRHKVTTWTGDILGNAILGPSYRDNFGGIRHSISVKAINGKEYYGTYYLSSGDYCRLRMRKDSRKAS
jgi:hypothetical protein